MILVDSSALIALASLTDENHHRAVGIANRLRAGTQRLTTTSYIAVESCSVLQRRAGFAAAEKLLADLDHFELITIDAALHRRASDLFRSLKSARVSIVDCASFCVMRDRGIRTAFAFDRHFPQQGFALAA